MKVAGSTLPYGGGSHTDLAYKAFAGLRMTLAESIDFIVKYRHTSKLKVDFTDRAGDRFEANYDVHDFGVGFTYYFGAKKNDEMAKKPQPIMLMFFVLPYPSLIYLLVCLIKKFK